MIWKEPSAIIPVVSHPHRPASTLTGELRAVRFRLPGGYGLLLQHVPHGPQSPPLPLPLPPPHTFHSAVDPRGPPVA